MVVLAVLLIVGWALLLISKFADSVVLILVGRFVNGLGGGAFALVAPLYISECSEARLRGGLASMLQFQSNLGVAFTDALDINEVASWTIISGVCMTFPILLVILIVTVL